MTAACTDPFLEGIYTALHYDFSNAILIYLKYIIELRSYSYTQKRKLKQLINQTNITSRQLGFTHLRAPTGIKPDEFYAPSTASVSLSRIHLYHLISKARRQTDHSVRQLVSGSVTNKIVLTHPLFGL